MTEGRFETVHNLRPKNWDNRRHWTNWHHLYDCEEDHIARESCPFHDLRAGGQFQYENWGSGPYAVPTAPDHVTRRADGDRMDFAPGPGTNLGGWGDIPLDTEAGRPTKTSALPRSTAMFTKKKPLHRGLFSQYEYMPEGPPVDRLAKNDRAALAGRVRSNDGNGGGIKAGGPGGYIGQPGEYVLDPYNDKINRGRIGHFKTGPVKHDNPPWMPDGEPDRKATHHHGPFLAGKSSSLHINGDTEWIPDPYDSGRIKSDRHPFRTWHTRTKWSMPTDAPWSTGMTTAEPRKGATLDLTDGGLPSLASHRGVSLKQTIGAESALASMSPPGSVRFK